MRNYSLSDKPGQDHFRISVKREIPPEANTPAGYVSNMLHDKIEVGSTIEIAPPCGEFFLDVSEKHTRPLVLLAAGVGITPINSILLTALDAFP
jgi:nitric oxide dioxygenase